MFKAPHTLIFGAALLVGASGLSTASFAGDPIEKAEEGKMAPGSEMPAPPEESAMEEAEEGKMTPGSETPAPPEEGAMEEAEEGN